MTNTNQQSGSDHSELSERIRQLEDELDMTDSETVDDAARNVAHLRD